MKSEQLENIHNNLINGNRRDCVKQIQEYGLYDFWSDYFAYLGELYFDKTVIAGYFSDMTISYFRITNR
jgi:hypothetical protein